LGRAPERDALGPVQEDHVNNPIQIKALTEHEAAGLTETAQFNALRPVRCKRCGHTGNFERRVFWIGGVPKAEQNSERRQALIAAHLKESKGVGSVFFKRHRKAFYVDSAVCKGCGSTDIEFDIELSEEMLAEVARRVGKPIAEVRNEIAALAGRIAGDDRKA
jgi:predicted Zn-ribbon and HTH transcriptional regulator